MSKFCPGNRKKYFQGWYFKQSDGMNNIAFIPGCAVSAGKLKSAFIQVITDKGSAFIEYPAHEFSAHKNRLAVKIGNSEFSESGIKLNIAGNLSIKGELCFTPFTPPQKRPFCPNIMGPFDYLPGMECRHYIYSMHHGVSGVININGRDIVFNDARGYCEGDRGRSFPKGYIWAQSNGFGGQDSCVMIAAADVPYIGMTFCGLTTVFKYAGREYRFATYNGAKISVLEDRGDRINIALKRGGDVLQASINLPLGHDLKAPKDGFMQQTVKETMTASLDLKVISGKKEIFKESGIICAAESFGKVRCMSYEPSAAAKPAKL